MAEKKDVPRPVPQPQNSTPGRPQFPDNRPINGDNGDVPGLIAGK